MSGDAFAAQLRRVRVRAVVPKRSVMAAPFGIRFGRLGPGFFALSEGRCWVLIEGEPPIQMQGGDAVVLLRPCMVTMADPPTAEAQPVKGILTRADVRARRGFRVGAGEVPTAQVFAGGFIDVQGLTPGLVELCPRVVELRGSDSSVGWLVRGLMNLIGELDDGGPAREALGDLAASMMLIAGLNAAIGPVLAREPERVRSFIDERIAPVVSLVLDFPERRWSMRSLSDEAGLSRSAFHDRFTAVMGEPPMAFVRRARLRQAKADLESGGVPVAEVARRCGYRTVASFSAAFRREMGAAPSDVARANRTPAPPASDESCGKSHRP